MEDLLNEEDFLPKAPNPWKRYWIFSIGNSLLALLIYFFFNTIPGGPSVPLGISLLFILPAAVVFIMVFGHKKYYLLKQKTIALGMLAFMGCNSLMLIIFALASENALSMESALMAAVIIGIYAILFGICWLTAFLIIKKKQKQNIRFN